MDFADRSIRLMLTEARSEEGTSYFLDLASEHCDIAPEETIQLRTGGSGGVKQFRRLRSALASAVARVTPDEAVQRYVAEKEKRVTVRRALGSNRHLPESVAALVLADTDHPARKVPEFMNRYGSVLEVLLRTTGTVSEVERVLADCDTDVVEQWFRRVLALNSGRMVHDIFLSDLSWGKKIQLLPHIQDGTERFACLLASCSEAKPHEMDWSTGTWNSILAMVPLDVDDSSAFGATWMLPYDARTPNSSDCPAPIAWVRYALGAHTSATWRAFASLWGGPEVLDDERIADQLTASEYLHMQDRHETSTTLISAERMSKSVKKIIAEYDKRAASQVVPHLKQGRHSLAALDLSDLEQVLILGLESESLGGAGAALSHAFGAQGERGETFRRDVLDVLNETEYELSRAIGCLVDIGPTPSSEGMKPGLADCDPEFRDAVLDHTKARDLDTRGPRPCGLTRILVSEFERRFPEADQSLWDHFVTLWDTWDGSAAELLATVEATL